MSISNDQAGMLTNQIRACGSHLHKACLMRVLLFNHEAHAWTIKSTTAVTTTMMMTMMMMMMMMMTMMIVIASIIYCHQYQTCRQPWRIMPGLFGMGIPLQIMMSFTKMGFLLQWSNSLAIGGMWVAKSGPWWSSRSSLFVEYVIISVVDDWIMLWPPLAAD